RSSIASNSWLHAARCARWWVRRNGHKPDRPVRGTGAASQLLESAQRFAMRIRDVSRYTPSTSVMSAKQPVSVLLCCAHSDASHVRPLVGKLEREGTTTRLIEGIEDDPHLFGKALDDSPGATLFVVCLSDTLGTSHYRRLT